MKALNIYLIGVGGQGIGLLSEVLMRASDYAGLHVIAVDTHGLAQRGGIVVSQIRMGANVHSPLIPPGKADIVIALERHEAMRGTASALKEGGTLIYYNTMWQPLPVRLNTAEEIRGDEITALCNKLKAREIKIFSDDLVDPVMQNIVLLARICGLNIIPGADAGHFRKAMEDLMEGVRLAKNLKLFEKELKTA